MRGDGATGLLGGKAQMLEGRERPYVAGAEIETAGAAAGARLAEEEDNEEASAGAVDDPWRRKSKTSSSTTSKEEGRALFIGWEREFWFW